MSMEKHGRGVEQAWQMLDTFASLGVYAFDLTQTDIDGRKRGFRPAENLEALRRWMPCLMESAIRRQHNVIVRPKHATVELVQLDDLSGTMLERLTAAAFLILATSAGNHQVWVAVEECAADLARHLRQGSGADPSASGATRVAGSVNFKHKYAPDFPMVRLLAATPKRTVTRAELEALGLVAPPDPVIRPGRVSSSYRSKQWPSYERCLHDAPPAHHSDRADVSRADFTFCLLAIDWGWSVAETCERLLEKSSKARENGEAYARLTVHRAAAAVNRRRLNVQQEHGKTTCDELLWTRKSVSDVAGLKCQRSSRPVITAAGVSRRSYLATLIVTTPPPAAPPNRKTGTLPLPHCGPSGTRRLT